MGVSFFYGSPPKPRQQETRKRGNPSKKIKWQPRVFFLRRGAATSSASWRSSAVYRRSGARLPSSWSPSGGSDTKIRRARVKRSGWSLLLTRNENGGVMTQNKETGHGPMFISRHGDSRWVGYDLTRPNSLQMVVVANSLSTTEVTAWVGGSLGSIWVAQK